MICHIFLLLSVEKKLFPISFSGLVRWFCSTLLLKIIHSVYGSFKIFLLLNIYRKIKIFKALILKNWQWNVRIVRMGELPSTLPWMNPSQFLNLRTIDLRYNWARGFFYPRRTLRWVVTSKGCSTLCGISLQTSDDVSIGLRLKGNLRRNSNEPPPTRGILPLTISPCYVL